MAVNQSKRLTRKEQLFLALITPPFSRIDIAAGRVGLARQTAYNYLNDPEFRQSVIDARNALMSDAIDAGKGEYLEHQPELMKERVRLALHAKSEYVRLAAIDAVENRALGKPTEHVEQSGPGGGPIVNEHRIKLESYADYFKRVADHDAGRLGDAAEPLEGHGDSESVDSARPNGKASALPDGILP